MQELTKTTCFVVTAAVLGLAAVGNAWLGQPGTASESEFVGKEFFPEFVTTEAARSLEVSAIDPETGSLKQFGVKSDGDLWRIPTHYDYPAEAAARIAQTSASVMGLKAEAIVGMGESEFEKFGVVDPLSDDLEDPETAGKRITLLDENGDSLVDYIVGNEIEDAVPTRGSGGEFDSQNGAKDFYIRRAEDSQTFRVSLNIDLSTRFSDWIDPDLLRINRPDVTQVWINNYKISESGGGAFGMKQLSKTQGDQLELVRTSPTDPWNLGGMDPTKEEIQTDRINEILGVLDEMVIVGVRPKFKYDGKQLLTPDLKPAEIDEFKSNPQKAPEAYRSLQKDLIDKGFNLGGTQEKLELVSENGELEFGTSKGLRYRLHVGGTAAGEDESIEIGTGEKDEPKEETETEKPADDSNRFLYVRVTFDETLLGDRPVEPKLPEPPVKPEGYKPVDDVVKEESKPEMKPEGEEEKEKEEEGKEDEEATEAEEKPPAEERNPQFAMYEEGLAFYETAKSEHEMNLTRYKQDNEAFDKKIEEGKALVDELNQRFGDWYYVISASNLSTIQSTRADLLKPGVTTTPDGGVPKNPPPPGISIPNIPGMNQTLKPAEEAKAEMEKPADQPKSEVEAKEKAEEAKEKADVEQPADASAAEKEMPAKEMPAKEKPVEVEPAEVEPAKTDKPVETETPKADPPADKKPIAEEAPAPESNPATEEPPAETGSGDGGV